ncbi:MULTISPECIES: chemotaxis protein CheX [unclassified Psychrobacter]|uniref:chemotaxis protein CheX n=1 Tax=unclassified Psychrobacter TaxID=196806 RepID=UPI00071E6972|nr:MULTISPECIES: chemotaxis protein CheX [unclassified Psychrobacter]OLF37096.1 chemotaxis protein CheX [Psychrobacter sp. Cmf 22.2]
MKEQKLQIFLSIISNYFNQFGGSELIADTPYLLENKQPKVHDYTGVIGISGVQKGVVYFSATRELLSSLLSSMGETENSEEIYMDLAGEVANTIAGNARNEFGAEFHISVPFVFKGAPQSIVLPSDERSFIIPITWLSQVGEIVVCLQD